MEVMKPVSLDDTDCNDPCWTLGAQLRKKVEKFVNLFNIFGFNGSLNTLKYEQNEGLKLTWDTLYVHIETLNVSDIINHAYTPLPFAVSNAQYIELDNN